MQRKPTMNDVARQAGVALKTVSRYVNGDPTIGPDFAERIRQAIADLGYRRNMAAARIRPGQSAKMIGLIISDLSNPYFAALARAIELGAAQAGYMLTIASSEENGPRHDRLVDRLLEQQVDAIIDVPPRTPGRSWTDIPPPLPPLVFVDRPGDCAAADTVLADNAGGARAATRALLEAGARSVAFVGDSVEIFTMGERLAGYHQALREAGRPAGDELVFDTAHTTDEAMRVVLELLSEGRVDAVFAANNRAAFGALRAFRLGETFLPLVGFDEFEAAALVNPPISVVGQDIAAMGRVAADLALARLGGDEQAPRTTVLPTTLILRGSERVVPAW
ncbi:MAG TPA: LacI family DNA-binding transcriptional regulator [Nakamurella multipartita]|nr:LacI family DNA-binding transcriptional regulator [Nakamurella multipartita]